MDTKKLEKWANLLLDVGKRNNLINFKDTKASTVEIVLPTSEDLFEKVDTTASFEVFDPKIIDDEDEDYKDNDASSTGQETTDLEGKPEKLNRNEFIETYSSYIRKNSQVLLYNSNVNPVNALKNIDKKARGFIEETGVNVAYIAFGFIHWKESENSQYVFRAPVLLAPVTFSNESAISPWFIKLTEADVVVNPTFSFKLESEYGMKMPAYEDEGLTDYLDKIEKQVSKLGWTVSRESKIGIFSFLKINMYRDLIDHQNAILANNNVRMLLGESYENESPAFENGEYKLENPLIELHNVIDADSSQIEAIEMAKSGLSFVLQGPPGTGKSQTITNIIAECIYDGKKVLFVSEKQAALNVVYDKLRKAGLEEFCLELHSYKSNKKDVINDLCKTLKTAKTAVSPSVADEIEKKSKSQNELDSYEIELHKPREVINKSLYQLYDDFARCRKAPDVKVHIEDIENKGDSHINIANNLLAQFVDFIPSIGYQYKNNAWYGYINQDTSYQMREDMKACISEIIQVLTEYIELESLIDAKYGIACNSLNQTSLWENFFSLASESDILTPSFLEQAACSYLLERLTEMEQLSNEIVPIRNKINELYDEEIYKLDAENVYKRLTRQYTSTIGRLFSSEYKKLISDIRINKKDGKKPSYKAAIDLTNDLSIYHAKLEDFLQIETQIKSGLGIAYSGLDSEWNTIINQISQLKELFASGASFSKLEAFSNDDYTNNRNNFHVIAERIADIRNKSKRNLELLCRSFDKSIFDMENTDLEIVFSKLSNCLKEYDKIDNWSSFNSLLNEMNNNQLMGYVDAALEANVPAGLIVMGYQRNFYRQWIDYIQHLTPILSTFNRVAHDKQVKIFGEQDETQFSVSKVQIKAEISAKRPSLDFISSGSAVSILLREGEKKRKQKSIRKLMEEAGELIQVIKPCFLMSPLSVSTFLNSEAINFDVVIFDEASQIFPQDAIGAIYRGKQLIVVGDSKQMPPSNFFSATVDMDDSDEDTGDITDFESILDLCSTTFPQLRLKWHYRSKYEQLIAFSNKNFYDNDLVTFPSPITDRGWIGVDYYNAGGTFDHKSRNNRIEAEYIVDLIFKNIEKYPERSLGVVAFSISQQDLIERLLSKRRQSDPSKEAFFTKNVAEPFFIKNLETVQGDERDTIIFSVAYAKDSTGRLMHNFGPLNRAGGERRLNVAVTRAKINVQLVASIHYTDIDLKRTSAEGVRLLREYLDYAENGSIALERTIDVSAFERFDSEFESEVCDFLRKNGFEVDTQVGCSNFRIDLGIKRPGTSDYVLAVECDGASYHSSKNARDRDRLRQQILESMGWSFYRIWSTDWFKNNLVEKERLLETAKRAVSFENRQVIKDSNDEIEVKKEEPVFEEEIKENHLHFPEYKLVDVHFLSSYTHKFQSFVHIILESEAPLSEEWLLKRIAWMFGREKVTSVVQREYEARMYGCDKNGIIRRNGFLYLKDKNNFELRVPGNHDEKRDIKYISLEELAAGMLVIIKQNVTVDKAGMFKLLANELGFQRVAENILARFEEALELLDSLVESDGNNITIR